MVRGDVREGAVKATSGRRKNQDGEREWEKFVRREAVEGKGGSRRYED